MLTNLVFFFFPNTGTGTFVPPEPEVPVRNYEVSTEEVEITIFEALYKKFNISPVFMIRSGNLPDDHYRKPYCSLVKNKGKPETNYTCNTRSEIHHFTFKIISLSLEELELIVDDVIDLYDRQDLILNPLIHRGTFYVDSPIRESEPGIHKSDITFEIHVERNLNGSGN